MSLRCQFHATWLGRVFLICVSVVVISGAKPGPIRKLTLDPDAPVVELFAGLEQDVFAARVAARDEFDVDVFVTNNTDKPQTVALPPAAAAVHVLHQQPPGGIFAPNGQNGLGQGGSQSVGGPLGAQGNNQFPGLGQGFQNQLPGNNFLFSIPPEQTVQLTMHACCLDHGKPSPSSKKRYILRRLENHTDDATLRQLLSAHDPEETDRMALQAAVWHLRSEMSWKELRTKPKSRLAAGNRPLFTSRQIERAEKLVNAAKEAAKDVEQRAARVRKKL